MCPAAPCDLLTGPIGARTNRAVALVTEDFVLYHRLAPFFERQGLPVLGLRPGERPPLSVQVVLDGPAGDPRSLPVLDDLEATWLSVRAALDERRSGRPVKQVVVGVDPGRTIGLAVLADDRIHWVREAASPREAVERIAAWATGLRARTWSIHVGDGSPQERNEILRLLQLRLPRADVRLVSESASTPGAVATVSRHTDAAILIARRPVG